MARSIPPDRFSAVVRAAAQVFITHGYQRTQVQDVADALGLAKGTLYGYAQGKEALFAAAVRYADGHEALPAPGDFPVPTPAAGEIAALVTARLTGEIADLRLVRALTAPLPEDATSMERGTELSDIVTDLYARMVRHRVAIKLVDRCAPELPDLAAAWFGTGRTAQVDGFEQYLVRRERAGTVNLPGPATLVARTIVELCALWAVHCHFDPAPKTGPTPRSDAIDDVVAASTIAEMVVRATATPSLT